MKHATHTKSAFEFFTPRPTLDVVLKELKTQPASHWERRGERYALAMFRYAYKTVPAYRKFLKEHGINGDRIKTIADFRTLPVMDKQSYLAKYEYRDLFPNRDLSRVTSVSATSGSTGEPFYFPRGEEQDWQARYVGEIFLANQFGVGDKDKRTLGIIGFGMGIWIGGILTYKYFNTLAQRGYRLASIPVGSNTETFLKAVKKFAPMYDQIILVGYPPFIKDVIDQASEYGVDWKKHTIKILTAAEGYSEDFRAYIAKKAFLKNPLTDTINIYGTVELGTMAHETPLSNLIRKIAVQRPEVFAAIFPDASRLPTLVQYHPYIVYFEEMGGEVIATGCGSSMPLLRYRFPDRGGVISYDTMIGKLKSVGVDILAEAHKLKIADTIVHLPFVYIYERSDQAVIIRGANIYAEEVRHALQSAALEKSVTGKFTMSRQESKTMDEYLEINVELKKDAHPSVSLAKEIQGTIVDFLNKKNSEFADQYQSVPKIMTPPVILWPYGHELHFKPGAKQKWVK